jgi:carbonic anhydrase
LPCARNPRINRLSSCVLLVFAAPKVPQQALCLSTRDSTRFAVRKLGSPADLQRFRGFAARPRANSGWSRTFARQTCGAPVIILARQSSTPVDIGIIRATQSGLNTSLAGDSAAIVGLVLVHALNPQRFINPKISDWGKIAMSTLDSMLERNKDFASGQAPARELMPRALPNVKAVIIGCADMRVDPAHVLGLKPGEAVVMRNIGGRITPGLLEQLGLLGRIGEVAQAIPGGGGEFHLIVLQHTDCGITRLAGDPALLTRYFQIPEAQLKTKAVTDPRAAVAVDVALLRAIPALPGEWLISGLVYDVKTGLVEIVVPAARLRAAA